MLPSMQSGTELVSDMTILPAYSENIRKENQAIRLMALSDIYKIYVPSDMSVEIYNKLYIALLRSLQKKGSTVAKIQHYENYKAIKHQGYNGIIGGADSATIIGCSGIGKSSAISRAISLITDDRIIEIEKPYTKIIPIMQVQCPFDCSAKGLLLEILRKADEILESNYYSNALRVKATADSLIGAVSNVCLNNVGVLIVDEIQNVIHNKSGRSLVGMLTQLINNSGISMFFVGTPECTLFFEQAMYLARRAVGLQYGAMKYDVDFLRMCEVMFGYQYVQKETKLTDEITFWLYEHSGGLISVVVALLHDAQEMAILSGKETLNLETLNEAYKQRLAMLHEYIKPNITRKSQTSQRQKKNGMIEQSDSSEKAMEQNFDDYSIKDIVTMAKAENTDIVSSMRMYFTVEEVSV